MISIVSKIDFL